MVYIYVHCAPGGVHFGILPPVGLRENAGFDVETVEDEAGLLGGSLAVGGLLIGVEAAVRQSRFQNNDQIKLQSQTKAESSLMSFKNVPAACDLDFDGFDAGFSFLEAGGFLVFSFLITLSFFFVLLTFFTVNSSSSLSAGSLKSSSLSEPGKT